MTQHNIFAIIGQDYQTYREMIDRLLSDDKTTGENHSEAMMGYTNMNVSRMKRIDKTAKLSEEMQNVLQSAQKQTWIVITEAWCGDAAQNIPWLQKMADLTGNIEIRYVLRDLNLNLMDQYLTNGGRSIPKLISYSEEGKELFNWGPRPKNFQSTYMDLKAQGLEYAEISKQIHTKYARDKGASIQQEFIELLKV